jgi:excisionase family DNA binding protein
MRPAAAAEAPPGATVLQPCCGTVGGFVVRGDATGPRFPHRQPEAAPRIRPDPVQSRTRRKLGRRSSGFVAYNGNYVHRLTGECASVSLPPEAAELFGVKRETIYRHVRRGTLPAVRLGGLVRIPADALDAALEASRTGPTGKVAT